MITRARERRKGGRPTIFFLDEIHRFNKAQQDALLPAVEEGLVTLIGATTENPYFEVNSALLSRCQIYEFEPLTPEEVVVLLRRALADPRGLSEAPPVADEALAMLAERVGGDARVALSGLERAVETTRSTEEQEVGVAAVEDALQRKALLYDREGDRHYDYISAWIKATRGSDVDASLYYLAVMLEGGEDPRFIARRMVILASEDIGNADPQALPIATAAAAAVDRVGLPECALNLAQAAVYLALAPKSNASTVAISRAMAHVRQTGAFEPPPICRTPTTPGRASWGAAAATATRMTSRGESPISVCCLTESRSASTSRRTAASNGSWVAASSGCESFSAAIRNAATFPTHPVFYCRLTLRTGSRGSPEPMRQSRGVDQEAGSAKVLPAFLLGTPRPLRRRSSLSPGS